MSCGCQVQSHCNIEGQSENRKVPFTEDGSQSTGQDWTEYKRRNKKKKNKYSLFIIVKVVKYPTTSTWTLQLIRGTQTGRV